MSIKESAPIPANETHNKNFLKYTKRLLFGSVIVVGCSVAAGRLHGPGKEVSLVLPNGGSSGSELVLYDVDTTAHFQLTSEGTFSAFSPDGNTIAYYDYDTGGSDAQLVIRNLKTGEIKKVAHESFTDIPSWSRDGGKLAFSSKDDSSDPYHIWIYDLKTNRLSDLGEGESPVLSPDGEKIAYAQVYLFQSPTGMITNRSTSAWVMDADGTNKERILPTEYETSYPSWSPDSTHLVVAGKQHGHANIFIVNADNPAEFYNLTNREDFNSFPSFSPDGTTIAFLSTRNGGLNLFVMDMKAGSVVQLTNDLVIMTTPNWSPDQKEICVGTFGRNGDAVYIVDIKTGTKNMVKTGLMNISWRPNH